MNVQFIGHKSQVLIEGRLAENMTLDALVHSIREGRWICRAEDGSVAHPGGVNYPAVAEETTAGPGPAAATEEDEE